MAVVDEPWYLILFDATDVHVPYSPITFMDRPNTHPVTQPHGFDREMVPSLEALWFALHLPRRVHDTFDLPLQLLRDSPKFDLAHRITMVPVPLLEDQRWVAALSRDPPALVFAAPALLEVAEQFAGQAGVRLGVLPLDALTDTHLRSLWRKVSRFSDAPMPRRIVPIPMLPLVPGSATTLAAQFLARQMRHEQQFHRMRSRPLQVIDRLVHLHATVHALRRAEELGHDEAEAERVFRPLYRAAVGSLKLDGVLAVPGVAPLYRRRLTAMLGPPGTNDNDVEQRVIAVLAAHRGAARTARTFITQPIPSDIWGCMPRSRRSVLAGIFVLLPYGECCAHSAPASRRC